MPGRLGERVHLESDTLSEVQSGNHEQATDRTPASAYSFSDVDVTWWHPCPVAACLARIIRLMGVMMGVRPVISDWDGDW